MSNSKKCRSTDLCSLSANLAVLSSLAPGIRSAFLKEREMDRQYLLSLSSSLPFIMFCPSSRCSYSSRFFHTGFSQIARINSGGIQSEESSRKGRSHRTHQRSLRTSAYEEQKGQNNNRERKEGKMMQSSRKRKTRINEVFGQL